MRNDADFKTVFPAFIDCQTDTVHGNRPFFDKAPGDGFRDLNGDNDCIVKGRQPGNGSHPVDVPGDQVTVDPVRKPERPLQINTVTDFGCAEGGL